MRAVNISYADRHFEGVNETDWDVYALEHFGCELEPDRNDDTIDRLVPRLARELGHAGFDAGGDWQWDDEQPFVYIPKPRPQRKNAPPYWVVELKLQPIIEVPYDAHLRCWRKAIDAHILPVAADDADGRLASSTCFHCRVRLHGAVYGQYLDVCESCRRLANG